MTEPRGSTAGAVRPTRKDEVRDAALTLFAQRGYQQTTINDIGALLNLRGPSLYNHIESKYQLLVDIISGFLDTGLVAQRRILASTGDPVRQLCEMVDVHVRYNAADPRQSFVGNRELTSLREPDLARVVAMRHEYERNLLDVIERGVADGVFATEEPQLAAYAVLAMGIHVSFWFRSDGPLTAEQVSDTYQQFALRLVDART